MKSKCYSLFWGILVCLLLVGCSDESNIEPNLSILGTPSLSFEQQGGSQTFSFVSAKGWTATSNQDWCKVTPSSGQGGSVNLMIIVEVNNSTEQRESIISVMSDNLSREIKIIQQEVLTQSKLSVIHTNWMLNTPKIVGERLEGIVYWGDSNQEAYNGYIMNHMYEEGKAYSFQMELLGAKEVEFQNLVGIKEIDLSGF